MTPRDGELLTAAFGYAGRGWPVFFLGRTKRPVQNCPACPTGAPGHDPAACECLTCHGFHAATLDPARIRAMHAAVPGGKLAIATGLRAGLAVADIDPRNGGAIDHALMPPTYAVSSGGRGWHLYYQHPGGARIPSRELAGHPGVDIKADGGYVVAPPSIHPDTRLPYRVIGGRSVVEMRRPLLDLARATTAAPAPSGPVSPVADGGRISSPPALLAALLAKVGEAPAGRRRTTLYGVARGVARLVSAGHLDRAEAVAILTDAGHAAGQSTRDTAAAIAGGFRAEGVRT
ncbi:bifunctional DNA primase/polymerase [Cryptosporangium phraense]|uniref:Bifunctional DNA primase/polymerase n=1 Tax=Cryptosporangium phraense TaxID=2593070 RepID=A0A545AQZ4_9ACTN|nr:bifunctional DNA primase/polymerase [Cryptosporangium phraense]TQS43746.1 bifunctional DNA primase/polymerase [Cryptosporangium phraense]